MAKVNKTEEHLTPMAIAKLQATSTQYINKQLKGFERSSGTPTHPRYRLRTVCEALFGIPGQDSGPTLTPIDRLNTVKAQREELKLAEEMAALGRSEDWDNKAAAAMKNLSNSLDALPDLLYERLDMDDKGFEFVQKVVDGFRTNLYNALANDAEMKDEEEEIL